MDSLMVNVNKNVDLSEYMDKFRFKAGLYYKCRSYISSTFLYEKIYVVTKDPQDMYLLARSYFGEKKFHEAISAIELPGLHRKNLYCRYMLAKCLYAIKDYEKALSVLNNDDLKIELDSQDPPNKQAICPTETASSSNFPAIQKYNTLYSAILILRSQVLQQMENRKKAALCLIEALRFDVYNYQALQMLMEGHMLTPNQFNKLLQDLPFDEQDFRSKTTKRLYGFLLTAYMNDKDIDYELLTIVPKFKYSIHVQLAEAKVHFFRGNYPKCYEITKQVYRKEKCNTECIPLHAYCLIELAYTDELYEMVTDLQQIFTNNHLSWFATGCYYYAINKQDRCRQFLLKALSMNDKFGPTWLLFGHSYSVAKENDQAMKAYFKAKDLLIGSHVPLMYIAKEFECNNLGISNRYLKDALNINRCDPYLFHELAVSMYNIKRYLEAEIFCRQALRLIRKDDIIYLSPEWDALFNNLGHICQKRKKYNDALEYYKEALSLMPSNASTYANISLIHLLLNNLEDSSAAAQRSIDLDPKNPVPRAILSAVLDIMAEEEPIIEIKGGLRESVKSLSTVKCQEGQPKWHLFKSILYDPSVSNTKYGYDEYHSFESSSDEDKYFDDDSDSSTYD